MFNFVLVCLCSAVQERNEQTPARADGGGGGGGRKSPRAATPRARRSEPRKASPSSSRRGEGGISVGPTGLPSSNGGGAVELRNGELLAGGKPRPTKEQLLVEEEERGAEAVAAVAAALRAGGATTTPAQQPQQSPPAAATSSSTLSSPLPASMGFATPSAAARPAMAPFSVSDTSDFEEAISPGGGPPRRCGSRGSETGVWASRASVAEGQEEGDEEEEGGVEGVAEVSAAAATHGVQKTGQGEADDADATPLPAGGAERRHDATEGGAGATSPLSRRSEGEESDKFFDAEGPSVVAAAGGGENACGAGKGGSDGASGGLSDTLLQNGGVVRAGEEEQLAHGEDGEDSLAGDGVGWKRAVGFVAPNSSVDNGGVEGEVGNGSGKEPAGSTESSAPGAAGAWVADADSEWSCSKVRDADRGVWRPLKRTGGVSVLACLSARRHGAVELGKWEQIEDVREMSLSAAPCYRAVFWLGSLASGLRNSRQSANEERFCSCPICE